MSTHFLNQQRLDDRFGALISARLNDSMDDIPHDISERLKVARMRALDKRKVLVRELQSADAPVVVGNSLAMRSNSEEFSLWNWLGSLLPLFALIAGLVLIPFVQDQIRAHEVADVDAELLTDVLPPAAYTDPGFVQFIKANGKD